MKRIINFTKENNKYIFKESGDKKLEIDVEDKILNGLDLYNSFFKEYNVDDTFELVDGTSIEDKKEDKMCISIFNKIKELFEEINKSLKIELSTIEDDNIEEGAFF